MHVARRRVYSHLHSLSCDIQSRRLSFLATISHHLATKPRKLYKKLIDIASDIPYSYSFIQKQFRQYVGIPPIEYFNSIKLTYAKEVLTNTETSIISIAGALGFESPAHFNHLFKRTFNITPTAYRKQTTSTSGGPNNN